MASVDQADGSEDVTDFLRRIKELGDQRDREDAERTRKLEEDIIQGRKQREARRADRARSLSPEKSSPSTTPRSMRSPRAVARSEFTSSPLNAASTPTFSATIGSMMEETNATSNPLSKTSQLPPPSLSPVKIDDRTLERPESPTRSCQTSFAPTRAGTLSWQQRPTSLRGPRTLDLTTNNVRSEKVDSSPSIQDTAGREVTTQDTDETALSRDQIARRLGSKDPSWFRQTEDRGAGSAAYRRTIQDSDGYDSPVEKKALHGMSRESTPSGTDETRLPMDSKTWSSTAQASATRDTADAKPTNATLSVGSGTPEASPATWGSTVKTLERPSSPTKASGGFVQSAMLKRSESVTKRWSVQTPPALNRQGSNTSGRGDSLNFASPSSANVTQSDNASQETAGEQHSRPGSSHSNTTPYQANDAFVRPALPSHKRSQSSISGRIITQSGPSDGATPPSPSKRWSPQKASWLESALNRPESPTPQSPPAKSGPALQPAWMVELNRAKQQRASRDTSDFKINRVTNSQPSTVDENVEGARPATPSVSATSPPSTKPKPASLMDSPSLDSTKSLEDGGEKTATTTSVKTKSKPETPPKKDFRAQLKSSKPPPDKGGSNEPEFLNAFGKLRRTQTEKYVAPDELKNNILLGKSALAVTSGPQKTPRKDELKESLIKQREAIKFKTNDSSVPRQQSPAATIEVLEAIAKKQALGQNDSKGNIMSAPKADKENDQGPASEGERAVTSLSIDSSPVITARSPPKSHVATSNNNLANKFNTGLASIIARGPAPSRNVNSSPTASRAIPSTERTMDQAVLAIENPQPGQLQHMTKGRARGPKRRLPKAGASMPQTEPNNSSIKLTTKSPTFSSKPSPPVKPRNMTPSSPAATKSLLGEVQSETSSKPSPPIKSAQLSKNSQSPKIAEPSSPNKAASTVNRRSAKDLAALWDSPSESRDSRGQPPAQESNVSTKEDTNLNRLSEISTSLIGPSSNFQVSKPVVEASRSPANVPAAKPQVSAKPVVDVASRNLIVPQPGSPRSTPTEPKSQPAQMPELGNPLAEFFDETIMAPLKLDVDTTAILSANQRSPDLKTKTIKKEMSKLGNDGKTSTVPQQQEHVLYSNDLYLCTHVFEQTPGARVNEVYLWAGSLVADAAVEDAQLFARRAAKDVGAKLLVVRQGKEPANFFQALGGIVITRSSGTRDNAGPYMLCGRQHFGHLAFDEVQVTASNLCSGFPYIVAAGPDKVFLWRGSGCNTEELAGARLISMDMGSTVTEVDEGKEPADLMAILSPSKGGSFVPRSADHWKLKTKYDNYRARLFRVEYNERPISRQDSGPVAFWNLVRKRSQADLTASPGTQIVEIAPFAQSDLQIENVYVLDAFFEIYIILGSFARSKPQAFASALLFAQEYAILAASSENRPYVPMATVVLEGAPRDLKRVFRTWDDSLTPTSKVTSSPGVNKGKGLRVMSLTKALGALRPGGKE